ncbi:hypothetical protein DPEC_G00204770 [Dallia pectoralis]|uniref:Uncharacterized protein n=1 Tax=Dallia pectoralis TaxID=75939 RepID=A0ACC2G4C8_DALPE|nr:hypothetical protein DPEC_G00204770 [Dallia pectoralis]
MEFKPAKSRSLVLKQGRVQDRFRFKIGEDSLPTVTEKPVKSLGKCYRADLTDKASVKEMLNQAEEWLNTLERSGLPGNNNQAGRQANIVVKVGEKWKPSGALREAEERLQHGDIMGTVTQGRLGLGVITRASWKEARAKERKGMVQKEIRAVEEE